MAGSRIFVFVLILFVLTAVSSIYAQTTEFTYQGQLQNASVPANGSYDFQFLLFDALSGGSPMGSGLIKSGVAVANGIFSVKLDFGAVYSGGPRFLEIYVKPSGGGGFQQLSPRQPISSAPYSVRSLNAASSDTSTNSTQLGGIPASGFIQNTINLQTADLNLSGSGFFGAIISAGTGYLLNGSPILSAPGTGNVFAGLQAGINNTGSRNAFFGHNAGNNNMAGSDNLFAGFEAGLINTTGSSNSFVGSSAGQNNSTGGSNSFLGFKSGFSNTTGSDNSFVGYQAGSGTTTGSDNSFFGFRAGPNNSTGFSNSIFGTNAGLANLGGGNNAFFGSGSGSGNASGGNNVFVGAAAGNANTTGGNNTAVGMSANVGSGTLSFATALGAGSVVNTSNSVVLGRAADTVRIPGNLVVIGSIAKGSGSFRIDHPLDPENKYLYHSFVESPDMMNVYNGNIVTDKKGEATVVLPDYFDALNRDFRYQLTVIGQFAQVIVAEKIKGNQFKIKTDKSNIEVSWQVTGIRHDKFADDERIKVEEYKPGNEQGKCTYAPACRNASADR